MGWSDHSLTLWGGLSLQGPEEPGQRDGSFRSDVGSGGLRLTVATGEVCLERPWNHAGQPTQL